MSSWDKLGRLSSQPGGGDPVKALQTALTTAAQSNQVSVLSLIQSYPSDITINGQKAMAIYQQVEKDSQYLPEVLSGLQALLPSLLPGFSLGSGCATPMPTMSPAPITSPTTTTTPVPSMTPAPIP
ncbi:alpha/beta hydrolase [Neosynechococcus sphagnicola]|uniref:alpha/beta hydrolase n=1 Tax=Neosynechococcus sphagnicola TaxID=1501145 RepID=UPI003B831E8C